MGFSIIFTIHFGVFPPIFGNTHSSYHKDIQRYDLVPACCAFQTDMVSWFVDIFFDEMSRIAGEKQHV